MRCGHRISLLSHRVFTEVTFWNSEEFRGVSHNFLLFNSAEFRAISCTEFRIRNLSNKFIQENLDFFVLKSEVEFENINFAVVYLIDHFGNNLCHNIFQIKSLTFSYVFFENIRVTTHKILHNSADFRGTIRNSATLNSVHLATNGRRCPFLKG
jgi:hypothetical protein